MAHNEKKQNNKHVPPVTALIICPILMFVAAKLAHKITRMMTGTPAASAFANPATVSNRAIISRVQPLAKFIY